MKLYEPGAWRGFGVTVDLQARQHCNPELLEPDPAGKVAVLIGEALALSGFVAVSLALAANTAASAQRSGLRLTTHRGRHL